MSKQCDLFPKRKLDGKDSDLAAGLASWLGNRKLGCYLYALVNSNDFITKNGLNIDPQTGEPSLKDVIKALDMNPHDVEAIFSVNKDKGNHPYISDAINDIKSRIGDKFKSTFLTRSPDGYVVSQENLDTDYGQSVARDTITVFEHIVQQVKLFSAGAFQMPKTANLKEFIDNGGLSGALFNEMIDRLDNNKLSEKDAETLLSIFPPEDYVGVTTEDLIKALSEHAIRSAEVKVCLEEWLHNMSRVNKINLSTLETTAVSHNIEQAISDAENDCGMTFSPFSVYGKQVEKRNIEKTFIELFAAASKLSLKKSYDNALGRIATLEQKIRMYQDTIDKNIDYLKKGGTVPSPINQKQVNLQALKALINIAKDELRGIRESLDKSEVNPDKMKAIQSRVIAGITTLKKWITKYSDDDEATDEDAIRQAHNIESEIIKIRRLLESAKKEAEEDEDIRAIDDLLNMFNERTRSLINETTEFNFKATKIAHFMSFFNKNCNFSAGFHFDHTNFLNYAQKYSKKALDVIFDFLASKSVSRNVIMSSFAAMVDKHRFEANTKKTKLTNDILAATRKLWDATGSEDTSFMYVKTITDDGRVMYFLNDGIDYQKYYENKKNFMSMIEKMMQKKGFAPLTLSGHKKLSNYIDRLVFGGKETHDLASKIAELIAKEDYATNFMYKQIVETIYENAQKLAPYKHTSELTPAQEEYRKGMLKIMKSINQLDGTTGIGKHLPPQVEAKNYETIYQNKSSDLSFMKRLVNVISRKYSIELDDEMAARFGNTHAPKAFSAILNDQSKLSQNFSQSLLKRVDSAAEYAYMNKIIPFINEYCAQIINQTITQARKKDDKTQLLSTEELADFMNGENLVAIINKIATEYVDDDRGALLKNLAKYVDSNIYRNLGGEGTKKVLKILRPIQGTTTWMMLCLNTLGVGANHVTAMFQMLEASLAKQDMKFRPFMKACLKSTIFGLSNRIFDTMSNKPDSLYTLIPRFFCPAGNESPLEIDVRKTLWGKMTKANILSLTYGAQESYFKEIVSLTILDSIKVKCNGKKMTLLQAIDAKDGQLVMKGKVVTEDGKALSFTDDSLQDISALINHVQTSLHGNYGKDKGLLRNYAWGIMLSQMKGWMGQVLHSFFAPAYWNPRTKRAEVGVTVAPFYARHLYLKNKELMKKGREHMEGSGTLTNEEAVVFEKFGMLSGFMDFNSFIDAIPIVAAYQSIKGYKYLSKSQQAAYRRFFIGSAMYALLRLLWEYLAGTRDKRVENNSPMYKLTMGLLERNIVERGLYSPIPLILIDSILTLFKNPIPAVNKTDDIVNCFLGLIESFTESEEESINTPEVYYDWIDDEYKPIDKRVLKAEKMFPYTRFYHEIGYLLDDNKFYEETKQK